MLIELTIGDQQQRNQQTTLCVKSTDSYLSSILLPTIQSLLVDGEH